MKTRAGKSQDCRDVIAFEKLRFQNVFRPHGNAKLAFSNSFGLRRVLEKLRFCDGRPDRKKNEKNFSSGVWADRTKANEVQNEKYGHVN